MGIRHSICAWALAVAACGDNIHEAPAPAPPDAPPAFVEAPHGDAPQVMSAGGAVVAAPKVVPIFFTGDDAARAEIETFLTALAHSHYWVTTTFEYGVGNLTIAPSIVSSDPPPTTDADLQAWLAANGDGTHDGWPAADPNTIYTVFLPLNVVLTAGGKSCKDFGGYHDETALASGTPLTYALIPRCLAATSGAYDAVTEATSHELIEATTDPLPFSAPAYVQVDTDHFIWGRTPGGELGDMCEYVQTAFQPLVGSYMVQRTWSNASARAGHDPCVPALATPYVSASPVLDDLTINTHGGGTLMTQGVVVAAGAPKTIEVDLFSDRPAAEFTVQALDAKDFTQTGTSSFSFAWDHTTGHNGDKLGLTITRTGAATGHGGEVVLISRVNNVVSSLWWLYVAAQ